MGKISKSDQDKLPPEEREALAELDKTAMEKLKRPSLHFAPGSFVLYNNRRAGILARFDKFGKILVEYEDGSREILSPIALTPRS